ADQLIADELPDRFAYCEGLTFFQRVENPDLERLYLEYMPLTFSRRHGDPSRPWNRFSIETRNPDGSKKLSYEGNWRDIFQNWEALGISYPGFLESMICKFVNASTADGYNPYRITRSGIDWEVDDPDDPWSYIGYWGDHQIIYLLKLMEQSEAYHPGKLQELLSKNIFVYANVPYRIKPYESLLNDPQNSIDFDTEAHEAAIALSRDIGSDGKLVHRGDNGIYHVNLTEKLLVPLLAKLSNFIPEAGIWMNTQRPEWNDANNALAGYGLSVVTAAYLHRFVLFLQKLLPSGEHTLTVSEGAAAFFRDILEILSEYQPEVPDPQGVGRMAFVRAAGEAGERYRERVYSGTFAASAETLTFNEIKAFLGRAETVAGATLRENKRPDNLYHSYNIMIVRKKGILVETLDEMLEGQAAML
ncbi:MAG TPA: hypothetical protein VJ904_10030, partial [Tichowtungia sp.]|nr:hypothetical protein [Tichowtungia sp.]